ncbi:MAG TPA: DUF4389 domain-containing protein [Mycobacterium sp.]|jgi:hypothetical protein|nr:DUF4389 domain-containing protein [Mycobacterium sp.]
MRSTGNPYPATFAFNPAARVANWRPLVNWLLAIPHLVIVGALRSAMQAVAVVSWFIILFTGRLPRDLANFQVMYLRYWVRTGTFAAFLREDYPPFEFPMTPSDSGTDARLRVDVTPQLEERNRLTVGFRIILVIPQLIVLALLAIAAWVVLVIAFFAVLFTGRWPAGLRRFVLNVVRWWLRVQAYLLLLTDVYPPFALQ